MRISDWSSDVCSSDLINRFADRDDLLAQYTRDGGRNLDRDLVGFKADDRFVDRHRIARLFQPFADRRFGDAFAKGGNCNFGAHGVIPCGGSGLAGGQALFLARRISARTLRPSASATSAACSVW